MASAIGSVFLGDKTRRRVLSSTSTGTPPSSPPPISPSSMSGLFSAIPGSSQWPPTIPETRSEPKSQPPVVDSALSLELRLRWLEAILLGVKQEFGSGGRKGKERDNLSHGETLLRSAEDVQKRLIGIVNSNDGLKRFMDHYDQHAHLLTPDYAVAEAPKYESMSASELEAFLVEMEPDIRAAERDMQEIEALEKKGVTGAGKLADYETFQPRLDALLKAHREDLDLVASLEKRVARLMEGHATQVDALSELFVAWDDTVMDAEDKILRLERDRLERQRLGFE
ncbi:hypothetical protein DFH08DRAFT_880222 [Mycena albidolilacea]|uniref:Uncharacterized protein n=1 Tax=Mycena albidolilacea TaxID=1033008 RepID=A0AAD6ZQ47_9AGAR|nr:hypothetical protein DFH08DRAFT_880222 [Mycena albidolilacea]